MPYGEGNPQLEEGFARIANEILDALARTTLTDYESRCIHYLWRKTYGWQAGNGESKKDDIIAYSQWADKTCIDKRTVIRTLHSLEKRNIVTKRVIKRPGKNPLTIWGFQKHYLRWNGYKPIQLELVSLAPPLRHEVVSDEPPLDSQVVATQPPLRHEVVSPEGKVVSPAPPTIDNKDTTTIDQQQTPLESNLIDILKKLKGWGFNLKDDLTWLRDFMGDYAGVEVADFKDCRDYYSTKPAKNKGPWKNRLRHWMANKAKAGSLKSQKRLGKLPNTAELEQQAKEKGLL